MGVQKLGVNLSVKMCYVFKILTPMPLATPVNRVSLHAHEEIDLPHPSQLEDIRMWVMNSKELELTFKHLIM